MKDVDETAYADGFLNLPIMTEPAFSSALRDAYGPFCAAAAEGLSGTSLSHVALDAKIATHSTAQQRENINRVPCTLAPGM